MFYGGSKNGGNPLPTIASPASAFTTVFGGALPTGTTADALFMRRKSILDAIKAETTTLQGALGSRERAKLDLHLTSIRQLENKLTPMPTGSVSCTKPAMPGGDSTFMFMNAPDALRGGQGPPGHHRERVRVRHHARRRNPVRQRPEVDGQRPRPPL